MILVKNIEIYSPEYAGIKDVLICGGKIALIEDKLEIAHDKIQVIDGTKKKMVPGFIDQHIHITGGGGEGSFRTRVPEINLSKLVQAGITTAVGLLGTDTTTRCVENLVAKAKALKEEGMSVYVHTGSYEYPTKTLTGSVKKDIVFIEEIIGAKVALSDHRSPTISQDELSRLASDTRVAGMLSGKAGVLIIHMGNGSKGMKPIMSMLDESDIPIDHKTNPCQQKKELLLEAFDFAKRGGIIDLTCGIYDELSPCNVLKLAQKMAVPLENITISSDGYGSWSKYNSDGDMIEIGVSNVSSIYEEFRSMVIKDGFDLEKALRFTTENVAKALNLYPKKGVIKENSDADILILDEKLVLQTVIANGRIMLQDGILIAKGTYE